MPRVAIARDGSVVAIRRDSAVELARLSQERARTASRVVIDIPGLRDLTCLGGALWAATDHGLCRYTLRRGTAIGEPLAMELGEGTLLGAGGAGAASALWLEREAGQRRVLFSLQGEGVAADDVTGALAGADMAAPLGGRRLITMHGGVLRIFDAGRDRDVLAVRLPDIGKPVAACALFGSGAIALLVHEDTQSAFLVLRPDGSLIHTVPIPMAALVAVAEQRGLALTYAAADQALVLVDLRYRAILARVPAPLQGMDMDLDMDAGGRHVVIAGVPVEALRQDEHDRELADEMEAMQFTLEDLFGEGVITPRVLHRDPDRDADADADADRDSGSDGAPQPLRAANGSGSFSGSSPGASVDDKAGPVSGSPGDVTTASAALAVGAQEGTSESVRSVEPLPELAKGTGEDEPDLSGPLLSLGPPPRRRVAVTEPIEARPYAAAHEYLADLLDYAAMRAGVAIALAWNTGHLSFAAAGDLHREREVVALTGQTRSDSLAGNFMGWARGALISMSAQLNDRILATQAQGGSLPLLELSLDLNLAPIEAEIILTAAAPSLRGDIARLYGILADDGKRPLCDRYQIERILAAELEERRESITEALTPNAPLVRHGVLIFEETGSGQMAITVNPAVLARMRGDHTGPLHDHDIVEIHGAERSLEELTLPASLRRALIRALLPEPPSGRPTRIVLYGRPGAGRRSLAAALAARNGRLLAYIDSERLPREEHAFAERLSLALHQAALRGALPCVSGLEGLIGASETHLEHTRAAFRRHPGPVVVCAAPGTEPPLDPDLLAFVLPTLSDTERFRFWETALHERELPTAGAERLASRFRIGPGTISRIIDEVARTRAESSTLDLQVELDAAARQHVATRIGKVATRVSRLPKRAELALPDDVIESLAGFIERVQYRRTVYDQWGYDRRLGTARGMTALFYGPPGTGKTMAAGVIAGELGLDLYRVDLARVTSRWIGETEKNLATVFDAAEDGQVVLVFDEADALFSTRTEVKTSVDRYANLEVNYLLQRLDTFEGIAVLTTNMEGSIDKAFRRRMTLRLAFPFPDEDLREQLWRAHLPPEMPRRGALDLTALARRYPMSGGYIRNSALRAAFLAAQEREALSQEHLERAIRLEYREMGKLAETGRLE